MDGVLECEPSTPLNGAPMKTERSKLNLPLILALLAAGCSTASSEESLLTAFGSACENQTGCGLMLDECATSSAQDATVAEVARGFRMSGATDDCVDMALEIYADHFTCVSNLSCTLIESDDCDDIIRDEAFEGLCPGL